jgi:hypothetical protein
MKAIMNHGENNPHADDAHGKAAVSTGLAYGGLAGAA